MKQGNILVEQVMLDGTQVEGYDCSLSRNEIFEELKKYFPNLQKCKDYSPCYIGQYKGNKYTIRCKNVTYLGNPHPLYKKRIQIPDDLQLFYNKSRNMGAVPILLGIYKYGDNTIFVDFRIDTYIEKRANNSSAHIYTSDLSDATEMGFFQKTDYFGNRITVFMPNAINTFLDDFFEQYNFGEDKDLDFGRYKKYDDLAVWNSEEERKSIFLQEYTKVDVSIEKRIQECSYLFKKEIIPKVRNFFEKEEKKWQGIECYKKMVADNYRNKFQPEWVGFFLEYRFEKYLIENCLQNSIVYYQDKKRGGIDLDLYFPNIECFGDLKAHSDNSRGIQGNDWETVSSIIRKNVPNNHIFYIVCEHTTKKDSEYNYEVTKYWNKLQNKSNLLSYHKRMKHDVDLKKVYILDINNKNEQYLTMFKQGVNSNGKPREPKIMIEQNNIDSFLLDEIIL